MDEIQILPEPMICSEIYNYFPNPFSGDYTEQANNNDIKDPLNCELFKQGSCEERNSCYNNDYFSKLYKNQINEQTKESSGNFYGFGQPLMESGLFSPSKRVSQLHLGNLNNNLNVNNLNANTTMNNITNILVL